MSDIEKKNSATNKFLKIYGIITYNILQMSKYIFLKFR